MERSDPFDVLDALHEGLREAIDGPESAETIATSRELRREAKIPPVEETHPLWP